MIASSDPHHPPAGQSTGPCAVIFDLDGVLTDTTELHYQSWCVVAEGLGIAFDRGRYDTMRGLSRPESLAVLLGDHADHFTAAQRQDLAERKNEEYLRLVEAMTPADLIAGVAELIEGLRGRGVRLAVASSSRNAEVVVRQLGIRGLLDVLVDANDAPRSKPDPLVFVTAAQQVGVPPARCVVLEDAAAGVQAARAAGMRVVGIGPAERVGGADLVVGALAELDAERVLRVLDS